MINQEQFAKTFVATKNNSDKKYIVKQYNKTKLRNAIKDDDKDYRQVLMNEIHIMRHLDHLNIPKLHEVYEGKNHIYLVIDFY